jgi:DNA-binding transcriptional LysR family regulator
VALTPLLVRLEREARGVRLDIDLPTDSTPHRLARGEFDMVLTPKEFLEPGHPAELLFEEKHVIVGCRHNPLLAKPLTRETFASVGHVAVRLDGRNTYIENELGRLG